MVYLHQLYSAETFSSWVRVVCLNHLYLNVVLTKCYWRHRTSSELALPVGSYLALLGGELEHNASTAFLSSSSEFWTHRSMTHHCPRGSLLTTVPQTGLPPSNSQHKHLFIVFNGEQHSLVHNRYSWTEPELWYDRRKNAICKNCFWFCGKNNAICY